jgi:hypothetical protein
MMILHACGMFLELGIVGVTLASLLSELREERLSGDPFDPHSREIVMTATSLALTIIAFCITMLGAGDTLSGLELAGVRISVAGNAVMSKVFGPCRKICDCATS